MTDGRPISIKSVGDVAKSINRCNGNYAFLVGAGTSQAAGIKTSNELIDEWIAEEYERSNPKKDKDEWVTKMEEHMEDYQNRYGFWFEQAYTTREERRQFIKEAVSDVDPTFEHIVLASLMTDEYIPITLTPNFDDLIYDAFYLYLEKRPFLVDHNAIAPQFRITHDDPMIVKLHGDYLYDNLKNTAAETRELENNIETVLETTLGEYGLIVLGYSGRDKSIMNVFNSDEVDIPDYGIYWCTLDRDSLSPDVQELVKKDNVFVVEIESSKEFFFDLYDNLKGLNVPTPVDIQERARQRADGLEEDIVQLGGADVLTLASEYNRRDEYENSIDLLDRAIQNNESSPRLYNRRGWTHDKIGNYEDAISDYSQAIEVLEEADESDLIGHDYGPELTNSERKVTVLNSRARTYLHKGEPDNAIEDFEECMELDEERTSNANLVEALIINGNISEGIEKAENILEMSDVAHHKIHAQMLIAIGTALRDGEFEREKSKFIELCEDGFASVWDFEELKMYFDDFEDEQVEMIEEIIEIYNDNAVDPERAPELAAK